jgi:thiamine-monophosphate kinase
LGGARAALAAWRAGQAPGPEARVRFARPEPRIAAGRWLRAVGATAAIDVSDGLAGDAQHLAVASGVGIVLELEHLPLGPDVLEAAQANGEPAPVFAAKGGEDYELLVTLPPDVDPGAGPVPISRIGRVTTGSGVVCRLEGRAIAAGGFDHFA